LKAAIVHILDSHRLMTIATNRADGWPQATTVAYINDGLDIYCFVARLSQKYANIARDPRVSIAIAGEFSDPHAISGLSMAGRAIMVEDKDEYQRGCLLLPKRFPEYESWPKPDPGLAPLLRIAPKVISVLDYSKGFGHSELVTLSHDEVSVHPRGLFHDWFGRRD
jgi:nitroimidazol reductase NimA-like FMN-containing flavoprotein (pyridoxamine 5'-phosphate oxidase superfamily)